MTEPFLFVLGLGSLLVLDLITVAARSALLHTSLAGLLEQRIQMEPQVRGTLSLIRSSPYLQASLRFVLSILRFLLSGLLLYHFSRQSKPVSLPVTVGLLLLAALVLFWIEGIVEGQIQRNSAWWALQLTPFARLVIILSAPFAALPLKLSGKFQGAPATAGTEIEEELKTLVDAGQVEGVLEQGEREMIYSVFELGDTLAREIMIPRIDIIALDVNTPLAEAADALLESGNSRVPVYEESVDNILGLLYAKDLLRVWRQGDQLNSLRSLLRPVYFIPEAKKADKLLAEMQSQRIHMAIVVDEYGGVAGLVTLEDIVEEILGEIQDEYDQGEESPYQELPGGEYVFQGKVDLDDFNEVLASNLPKDEADTVGGFIYSRIGHVPHSGERIQVNNLLLTVEQVTGRRIRKVRAERVPSKKEEDKTHVDG